MPDIQFPEFIRLLNVYEPHRNAGAVEGLFSPSKRVYDCDFTKVRVAECSCFDKSANICYEYAWSFWAELVETVEENGVKVDVFRLPSPDVDLVQSLG